MGYVNCVMAFEGIRLLPVTQEPTIEARIPGAHIPMHKSVIIRQTDFRGYSVVRGNPQHYLIILPSEPMVRADCPSSQPETAI
jgi:hypothetical protein